jgi:hypothetical protein
MYNMIYFLTAIGLSPSGSTHLHTNNTQNNTNNNGTTQITINVEECGPCPVFVSFTTVGKERKKLIGYCKWPIAAERLKENLVQYSTHFTGKFY